MRKSTLLCSLGLCSLLLGAAPMPTNTQASRDDWWKHAVIYQVYPRSFADSNNDGVGDLKGIANHVDYLRALGVDAVWITPMFPSPQVDFGYDVSDYDAVDPQYGTMADMDGLISKGKNAQVKFLLDFVVNHTSDKAEWFQKSRASKDNPYRDFYVWRDGKAGGPPNNWTSGFGGSAWEKDPATGQYYYHYFYAQQPDLNWRNPKVEKAMFDAAAFWFKRGIYGFRLDAVDTLFENTSLADNPPSPGKDQYGAPNQKRVENYALPEVHTELQKLRADVVDKYPGRILVGETYAKTGEDIARFYGPSNNEVQLPMFLSLIKLAAPTAPVLRDRIEAVEANPVGGWPCFALDNHDNIRSASRWTPPGADPDQISRLTGAMLMTLRGTPILYYGQEIGMVNNDPKRIEDVLDIIGKRGWPKNKGRDGERTPMQWDDSVNAGFNKGAKPWLPVGPDAKVHNVAAEQNDPNSVLSWYRNLIALRRTNPALSGDFESVDRSDANVLAYLRKSPSGTVLVLLNFSNSAATVHLSDAKVASLGKVLAQSGAQVSKDSITLRPFAAFVAEAKKV